MFKTFNLKKTNGKIINVGSGNPIKIKKAINLICKMIGAGKPRFGKLKYKKNINMKLYPDITRAKKLIKWKPKINFLQGIKLTISTFKNG